MDFVANSFVSVVTDRKKVNAGAFSNWAEVLPALPGHRRVGRLVAIIDEGLLVSHSSGREREPRSLSRAKGVGLYV